MSLRQWRALAAGVLLASAPLALPAQRAITLAWDPSPGADVIDYVVYFGTNAGVRPASLRSGGMTTVTIPGLIEGRRYFFAATAVNRSGVESDPTPEVSYLVPVAVPTNGTLMVTVTGNGSITPNLSGQSLTFGQTYTLTAVPATNYVFDRWTGGVTSSSPVLTFVMRPGLALEAVFVTNNTAPLMVTINGNGTVTPNLAGQSLTFGQTYTLTAVPATNYLFDRWTGGVTSSSPALTFVMRPGLTLEAVFVTNNVINPTNTIAPLIVTTRGDGTVTPNLSGQSLIVGQTYTLTATPGTNYVFGGWTGGVTSSSPALTFVMRSGLALEAVFAANLVTNVVQGLAMAPGTYTGLFGDEDPYRQDRSGSFTVTTTQRRTCSGKLQFGGRTYSFSGQLGAGGFAVNAVARYRTNVVGVELIFGDSGDPDDVNGRLTTGAWQTPLRGHHAVFNARTNPAPCAGRYTLIIPGQDDPRLGPEGDGVAAVNVDSYGRATLAGTLADGTRVSYTAVLSKRGQWPVYVPLYSGGGSIWSWLTLTRAATNGIEGRLHWIKPAMPKAKQYAQGFTNLTEVAGSLYVRPASSTNRVLELAQAAVVFDGGNLSATLTNTVALSPRNKVINLSGSKLSFAISPSIGLFRGSIVDPFTRRSLKFKGALLQDQNCGCGFLLGTNRSSRVWFGL